MAEHRAIIEWKSSAAEFLKGKYSRDHTWSFDGGQQVSASAAASVVPAAFVGPNTVDPEEALVAATSSCHMLTFLYFAQKQGFEVQQYRDEAVGHVTKNERGIPWVSLIELHPTIVYAGEKRPNPSEEQHLHEQAHQYCFISNSIKSEVRVGAGSAGH